MNAHRQVYFPRSAFEWIRASLKGQISYLVIRTSHMKGHREGVCCISMASAWPCTRYKEPKSGRHPRPQPSYPYCTIRSIRGCNSTFRAPAQLLRYRVQVPCLANSRALYLPSPAQVIRNPGQKTALQSDINGVSLPPYAHVVKSIGSLRVQVNSSHPYIRFLSVPFLQPDFPEQSHEASAGLDKTGNLVFLG